MEYLSIDQSEKLIKRKTGLLIIKKVENGFIATDFEFNYLLSKDESHRKDYQSVWCHNQPWVIFRIDEQITFPVWFSREVYDNSMRVLLDTLPENGSVVYKSIVPVTEGDGFCYHPAHNSFTGAGWYSNNVIQAVVESLINWTPIFDISLTPMVLLFDNGNSRFGQKPIQIWKRDYEYSLTFFGSKKEKSINVAAFSPEAIQLIKYATDAKESKWRLNKRWAELLKFNGQITEFENLSEKYISHFGGHTVEAVFIARADEYYLVRFEWGGLYGGEGDTGEDFYFFENESEFLEKLNTLIKHD